VSLSNEEIQSLLALNASKQVDYAWAAGIIDGEGCIALTRSKRSFRLGLWVGSRSEKMINRLRDIFEVGGVYETYPHGKSFYVWRTSGMDSAYVLILVRKHLVVKEGEADIAIRFAETIMGPGRVDDEIRKGREEMFEEIQRIGNRMKEVK
jgi:hypothetical protein